MLMRVLCAEHSFDSTGTECEHDETQSELESTLDLAVIARRKRKMLCLVFEPANSTSPDERLEEVSRWLAALDYTEKHDATLKHRQEGTCKWFPNTDAYKEWRNGENYFLWLHGKGVESRVF